MNVQRHAFVFCKISVAILAWLSFAFRSKVLVLLCFLLLFSSALLKIRRAPLIVFYSQTIGRLYRPTLINLDEKAMQVAHSLGSVFSGICVLLVYFDVRFAWGFVLVFAIMKTVSALGFCPGEKLYSCMKNGCCRITRK